jgi:hypothetical protein
MKTRAELVHRALKNLGALPQGQTPSAEEYDSINDLVTSVIAKLKALEIITIRDPNNIEEAVFLDLGHVLAEAARSEFGNLGTADAQELAALAEAAKLNLRDISAYPQTFATLRISYP